MSTSLHYFIESEKLGSIVEGRARGLLQPGTKRERAARVKAIARVLVDLEVIHPVSGMSISCAYGVRSDGTVGLLVVFSTIKIQGEIAP